MLRRKYNLGHHWITNAQIGDLHPIGLQEVLPGDTFSGVSSIFIRLAPMDFPAFVSMMVEAFVFFVPNRIVWDGWEDYITGSDEATPLPTITLNEGELAATNLFRNWGVTWTVDANNKVMNALPLYGYNMIYNEFFRDQEIDNERALTAQTLANGRYKKEYFTTARDEVQQGNAETVPVVSSAVSVTAIRDALHKQHLRERRAQFGERYYDYLRALGLKVPSSRLQRPEFVGKGRGIIGVSEVVTTATTAEATTGGYRGHGILGFPLRHRPRTFVEHGYLHTLLLVRPRFQIKDRLERHFLYQGRDDYYQPELAMNTQDTIWAAELFGGAASPRAGFGYTARYEHYRTARDIIAGNMAESANDGWTLARKYTAVPTLTSGFAAVDNYVNVFQDQTGTTPYLFCFISHNIAAKRIVSRRPK